MPVAVALGKIIPQINKAKVQAHVFLSAIQENEAYKAYAEPTISRVMTSPYYLKVRQGVSGNGRRAPCRACVAHLF